MMDKLGKGTKFVEGLRVTDSETMDVEEMVLGRGSTRRSSRSSTKTAGRRSA